MKKMDIRKDKFNAYISFVLVSLSFAYPEFLVFLKRGFNKDAYVLDNSLFLTLSIGLVLAYLISFIPWRVLKGILAFAVSEGAAFVYTIEYFLDETYSVFMSPSSISLGAKGVIASYKDMMINVIRNGWKDILLFQAIPFAVILAAIVFRKAKPYTAKAHVKGIFSMLTASCLILSGMSICNLASSDPRFTYEYNFNGAVRSFGLAGAVGLDLRYSKTGVPEPPRSIYGGIIYPDDDVPRNVLDADWEAIKDEAKGTQTLLVAELIEKQESSEKNDFTGMFKGKNLVQITVESFSKELLDTGYFPLLKRMADNGIVIEDYYHPFWGGSTISGEAAVISGILPTEGATSMQNMIGKNNGYTLASDFNELGYRTVAYHNGDEYYYNRTDTHPAVGFSEFYSDGTGMESYLVSGEWPRSDLDMFNFIIDDFEEHDAENFYAYIMTFSGHGLYNFYGNEIGAKNHELLKGSKYYDLQQLGGYVSCSLDFELGLELFYDYLDEKGLLEDTVFVMTDDHYPYALQKGSAWYNDVNYLSDLYGYEPETQPQRDHNSLIIWTPFLETLDEEDKIVVEDPVYALDIVPTLKNLFGIDYESRMFTGRDILSDTDPLVIWVDSSFMTDKGYYDSSAGIFYPKDENEYIPAIYVEQIKQKVRDKMTIARNFVSSDFYDLYSRHLVISSE